MNSRLPGFYRLSIPERRAQLGLTSAEATQRLATGGLSPEQADKLVENVIGVYALPFGVALNVLLNGEDRLAPMVVEEPSVIAAASNAAKMIRAGGGFQAEVPEALMIGQIQLFDVADPSTAQAQILAHREPLLQRAAEAAPNLIRRGGGPRDIEVRPLEGGMLVVHVLVDCRDAMGANLVNTIAEYLGPEVARLAGGKLGLRILTNLSDRRTVKVQAKVPLGALSGSPSRPPAPTSRQCDDEGAAVAEAIEQASRFAEADPYRAATHNKGLMNGLDSVVIATGNDYRAVEAGAHAYAARTGRYSPLACWRRESEWLVGRLELPLSLGIVGGTLKVHPGAQLALQLTGISSAAELAQLAASVGLASNLAALRALATDGIQRGHMSLHARSVAVAAGAEGEEVERLAAAMMRTRQGVTQSRAEELLAALRRGEVAE